jgi:hypothetical protein
VQTGLVPTLGGQPAHVSFWPGDQAIANARIRPRHDGWIAVQNAGSAVVRDCVTGRITTRRALARLDALRRRDS